MYETGRLRGNYGSVKRPSSVEKDEINLRRFGEEFFYLSMRPIAKTVAIVEGIKCSRNCAFRHTIHSFMEHYGTL